MQKIMGKKNILYRFKIEKVKKKINDPKKYFTKFFNYCETIDFTIEPGYRYIIPLKWIKANKK